LDALSLASTLAAVQYRGLDALSLASTLAAVQYRGWTL